MPNGNGTEEKLRRLRAAWRTLLRRNPEFSTAFPEEPWDAKGNWRPGMEKSVLDAVQAASQEAPPTPPVAPPQLPTDPIPSPGPTPIPVPQPGRMPQPVVAPVGIRPTPTPWALPEGPVPPLGPVPRPVPAPTPVPTPTPIAVTPDVPPQSPSPGLFAKWLDTLKEALPLAGVGLMPTWEAVKSVAPVLEAIQKRAVVPAVSESVRPILDMVPWETPPGEKALETQLAWPPIQIKGEPTLSFDQFLNVEGGVNLGAVADFLQAATPALGLGGMGARAARGVIAEHMPGPPVIDLPFGGSFTVAGPRPGTEAHRSVQEEAEKTGAPPTGREWRQARERRYPYAPFVRGTLELLPDLLLPSAGAARGAIKGTSLAAKLARGALAPIEAVEKGVVSGVGLGVGLGVGGAKRASRFFEGAPSTSGWGAPIRPGGPAAREVTEAVPDLTGPAGDIPTGARPARQEIEDIISRVPETSVNTTTRGKRSAAAIVRRNFDELLAGGEVKGRAAKVSYIVRQTGRSKEEINGLIGRGPTEPPAVGVGDNFTTAGPAATQPANLTPSFGRELGRGVYFSTDRQIAQGFAEGRAPFLVGTARTRKGTEVVSRFVIPKDTKIFTRDKILDIDLLEQLQQRPTFARHWADEWSLQPASRDNIWAAVEETRMLPELQSLLESQGFKGARHTQGPGQFDYAIWDSSIIKKEGTGLQLFRGAAPTGPAAAREVTEAVPDLTGPAAPTTGTVAPAVQEALRKAGHFREIDAPGRFSRFLDAIPGVKQVYQYIRPGATKVPVRIQTAYVAQRSEEALFSAKTALPRQRIFDEADRLFGPGATQDAKVNVRFIGAASEARTINGLLFDVAQRPHLYELSAEQGAFLTNVWQPHNSKFMKELIELYGAGLKEFPAPRGGVFLSNVDIADDVLEGLGISAARAVLRGRGKTRIFETAADRMASRPTFKPQTNIRTLQTGMDAWKARVAGNEVFKQGAGGLTRVQAVDATHPTLRTARDALASRIRNLRARVDTAGTQARLLKARARQARTQARQAERRAEPMLERIEELGPEYGPELSFLSGQARELMRVATQAEARGVNLAVRAGTRRGAAKTMVGELSDLVPELDTLQRQYAAANLGDLQLVEKPLYRYFPSDEAKAVRELHRFPTNTLVKLSDEWRGTAFAGDLSPIAGIQMPLGFVFSPKMIGQRLVGAIGGTIRSRDPWYIFRARTLADEMAEDVVGWQEFSFWSGIPVRAGTPEEFSGGLLRFIPGFTKANEAMYRLVMRQTKALYDSQLSILEKGGFAGDSAKMAAADISTMIYPIWNPTRLGLSPARAAAFRAMPTSVSFLIRPAAFITKATTGFVKLGTGQPLSHTEKLAVRLSLVMSATTMTLSISSSVISALERGSDPWEAVLDVIDPASPKFASIVFGTRYVPIGGPYRSMIKMIVPREVDWAPFPVPFATLGTFARNRINPALRTQLELHRNKDFYGTTIRKGKFPEEVLRILLYEVEGLAPLTAGTVIGGVRRGVPAGETAEEAAAQFLGTNIGLQRPFEKREDIGRRLRKELGVGGTYSEIIETGGYGAGSFWAEEDTSGSPTATWQQSPATRLEMLEDPAYVAMSEEMRERVRDPELAAYYKKVDLLFDNVDKEDPGLIQQLEGAWEGAQLQWPTSPGKAGRLYREVREDIFTKYHARKQGARTDAERAGIFRDFEPDGPFRKAEDIINRVLFSGDEEFITDETGSYAPLEDDILRFNWDERNRRMKHLIEAFGDKFVDDVTKLARAKLPEFERERREDVDAIAATGYWDVDNIVAAGLGLTKTWEAYKKLTMEEASKRDKDEDIRKIKNSADKFKHEMRRASMEPGGLPGGLQELLAKWGYVTRRPPTGVGELLPGLGLR